MEKLSMKLCSFFFNKLPLINELKLIIRKFKLKYSKKNFVRQKSRAT